MELVAPTPAPSSTRGFSQTKKAKLRSLESEPHLLSKLPLITHPVPQGFSEKSFSQTKFLPLTDTTRGWRRLRPLEPLNGSRKSLAGAWKNCMSPHLTTTETILIPWFEASFNSVTPRRIHKAESQKGMGVPSRCSKSGIRRSTENSTASWIKCYVRKQTIKRKEPVGASGDNAQKTHRLSAALFQNRTDISQYIRLQSTKRCLLWEKESLRKYCCSPIQ